MEFNTVKMEDYAEFLEESSVNIIELCNVIELRLQVAAQCMDQESGRIAAAQLWESLQRIKNNVPISDDTSKRLVRSRKRIVSAGEIFGG